ncbi:hypothetical protein PoB_002523800 [Plakobranchus ocellatus]|uniref:Uncharacterized protein n=1 Tax=Plakobranchus ocellatus TaxID=259542 RepID=A0AAV3ZV32_9GAST|nr:hypothetical protein PoB_002523800 [Plakobranchus ocellatus]
MDTYIDMKSKSNMHTFMDRQLCIPRRLGSIAHHLSGVNCRASSISRNCEDKRDRDRCNINLVQQYTPHPILYNKVRLTQSCTKIYASFIVYNNISLTQPCTTIYASPILYNSIGLNHLVQQYRPQPSCTTV